DRWHATDPPLADTPVAEGLARALDARQAALVALKTPWVSHAQAALEALDALSVAVEDADAHTPAERALFGEPGLPPPAAGWQRSQVVALFDT
ncbi:hypothetical protein U6J54_12250, partial [Cutibacterium acnes]